MKSESIPESAKKVAGFLKAHAHVKAIYVNDSGDYHLHAVAGFKKVTREEFLEFFEEQSEEQEQGDEGEQEQVNGGEQQPVETEEQKTIQF